MMDTNEKTGLIDAADHDTASQPSDISQRNTRPDWEKYGLRTSQTSSQDTQRETEQATTTSTKSLSTDDSQRKLIEGNHQQSDNKNKFRAASNITSDEEDGYQRQRIDSIKTNELFQEEQDIFSRPWWKANFFISAPVLFGAWDGVFTACLINIFGIIIFLRTGWMVGNVGILLSMVIILMTIAVALIAALSAIGVCERCQMESGGVYFLLSHILGGRIGAAIGVLYCFGQAVSCSLYTVGFGESVVALITNVENHEWISRAIATGVVLLLVGINLAGVKWVIRLQLVLLLVLAVAVLDFLVGSFAPVSSHKNENGTVVIEYSADYFAENTYSHYLPGQSFFTVFGVFFPTATGVFAGINMSGDLKNPSHDIPVGTLSAVGTSTLLYVLFAVVLAATCSTEMLKEDYMIAEKVSLLKVLWLTGLYMASISSCMGALYASPRVLQSIAQSEAVPVVHILGRGVSLLPEAFTTMFYITMFASAVSNFGSALDLLVNVLQSYISSHSRLSALFLQQSSRRGPNRVPVYAMIATTFITLLFIVIGDVNALGPVVTMPFMLTYAAVDYAYFALAKTFDIQNQRNNRYMIPYKSADRGGYAFKPISQSGGSTGLSTGTSGAGYGTTKTDKPPSQQAKDQLGDVQTSDDGLRTVGSDLGSQVSRPASDLDELFPERMQQAPSSKASSVRSQIGLGGDAGSDVEKNKIETSKQPDGYAEMPESLQEIYRMPTSWYSFFVNRWISLFGAFASIVIMFAIQWGYALANISVALIIYVYIGQANPGVFPGISQFSLFLWVKDVFLRCIRRNNQQSEQIIVQQNTPAMSTMAAQLTEDNEDFASRSRYHQSELVKKADIMK